MKVQVIGTVEVGPAFLSDVLTTAFDMTYGGSWYWAQPDWEKPRSGYNIRDGVWYSVAIFDRDYPEQRFVVDHLTLQGGINWLFRPGVLPGADALRTAILEGESGDVDSIEADLLVQLALFGEVRYS